MTEQNLALPDIGPDQGQLFDEKIPYPYKVLRGHNRTNGSFKDDETLHAEYVHLTDNLIYLMTHGTRYESLDGEFVEDKSPDYVIWLDKSARPVAWLTSELWPTLAREQDGSVPQRPQFAFVNIDREQWAPVLDPLHTGSMDFGKIEPDIFRSLRSIFVSPEHREEGLTEAIDAAPSDLDGKCVLIIDEVRSSGRTLATAQGFFKHAFPTAHVAGAHWMSRMVSMQGGGEANADLPVWYRNDTVYGRGIGDRDVDKSRRSPSRTQRLGAWFLSTTLEKPDSDGIELRHEIRQLAQDARGGNVLVVPSFDRDDYFERATRLNAMSRGEFQRLKAGLGDL